MDIYIMEFNIFTIQVTSQSCVNNRRRTLLYLFEIFISQVLHRLICDRIKLHHRYVEWNYQ